MAYENIVNDFEVINATFVIIGGGIAGVSCAEQLAVEAEEENTVLISASPIVKVTRSVIKLSERLEELDVEEQSYLSLEKRNPNCQVILATALKICDENKEIYLSNHKRVSYKCLCICSGALPRMIFDNPLVLGIRDTETVEVFQKKLCNARRVLVIGNGGIATELVYEIENCKIIWVIKDKSVGATFFDAGAANFFLPCLNETRQTQSFPSKRLKYELEGHAESKPDVGSALGPDWSVKINMKGRIKETRNVQVEYECEVKRVYEKEDYLKSSLKCADFECAEDSWPLYVELTNGSVYGCDFLISATGVIPNTSFLDKEKFTISDDGGIAVNEQMQTNVKDVFAAGDVCTATWPLAEHWFQMRLWTQARQMGAHAAKCMVCHLQGETAMLDICFDLFTHVTRFFGYKVVLLGLFNGQKLGSDYELVIRSSERAEYAKVVLQNGRMQGAVLIGETDLEETFENLILNRLDLSAYGEDILNPDVDIEDYFD